MTCLHRPHCNSPEANEMGIYVTAKKKLPQQSHFVDRAGLHAKIAPDPLTVGYDNVTDAQASFNPAVL